MHLPPIVSTYSHYTQYVVVLSSIKHYILCSTVRDAQIKPQHIVLYLQIFVLFYGLQTYPQRIQ